MSRINVYSSTSGWTSLVGTKIADADGNFNKVKASDKLYINGVWYEFDSESPDKEVQFINHRSFNVADGSAGMTSFDYRYLANGVVEAGCFSQDARRFSMRGANGLFFARKYIYDSSGMNHISYLYYSTDGKNWHDTSLCAWTGSVYFLNDRVQYDGTYYWYVPCIKTVETVGFKSLDGITWTEFTVPAIPANTNSSTRCACSASMWCIWGYYGDYYYSTDRGESWTYHTYFTGEWESNRCPIDVIVVGDIWTMLFTDYSFHSAWYGSPVNGFSQVYGATTSFYPHSFRGTYFNGKYYYAFTSDTRGASWGGFQVGNTASSASTIDFSNIVGESTTPVAGRVVRTRDYLYFIYAEYLNTAVGRIIRLDLDGNYTVKTIETTDAIDMLRFADPKGNQCNTIIL